MMNLRLYQIFLNLPEDVARLLEKSNYKTLLLLQLKIQVDFQGH